MHKTNKYIKQTHARTHTHIHTKKQHEHIRFGDDMENSAALETLDVL